jgi:tetratricopeptide (TPR) repeat protein
VNFLNRTLKAGFWYGLVLTFLLAVPSIAQKKKKVSEDSPAGLKLRESEFYFTEGEKFYILEDFAKALIYYQKAIESNPENGTIHYKIAEVLSRSNKPDDLIKASVSIETALRFDRSNKYFYLSAATIYNSLARFDKAAEAYEQMIREIRNTDEYLYELAAVYQYGNRPEQAIETYDRAEKVFGVNEISSVQKIRLFLEAGKNKEAMEEGEKLIRTFPSDEKFVMAFTEVLSQKGLQDQAIGYLEKFVAENNDAANAKMLLAGFYRDKGAELKARPLLLQLFADENVDLSSKLIMLGAYNAELNYNKTNALSDPAKEAFALSLLDSLRKQNSTEPAVHIIGGDLFLSTGKLRDAQREYQIASESDEVNFEVWENLLYLDIQLEYFDLAISHADKALEIFPNQAMVHYFSGFAHLRKRHFPESIFAFEQAKKLSVNNSAFSAEINAMLGDAYHAIKDYAKADKAFEDALQVNPENSAVLNNYSYYLAVRKENLEKAEKMAALLVKNNPDNPAFLDTYAWVLFTREKFKEARKAIEKAISSGKANATHFEHYGDILYKLGDVDAAVMQWEKARGLNAKSENLTKKIANRKIYE